MATMNEALQAFDTKTVQRVLRGAGERFQVKLAISPPRIAPPAEAATPGVGIFSEFHELMDAADPKTSVEYALVAAYWFQVVEQNSELDSQQLNSALKNLGHPSSNITRDLDGLINRTPRLLMQVRKDGSTKQARKRYKLTTEGVRAVERMVAEHSALEA